MLIIDMPAYRIIAMIDVVLPVLEFCCVVMKFSSSQQR